MTAVIYFHPDGYDTDQPHLMGRQSAGASFLRALFLYAQTSEFMVLTETVEHAQVFEDMARKAGRQEPIIRIRPHMHADITRAGTIYQPGPNLSAYAWQRSSAGHGSWSLCGITHTTCTANAMDSIADWLVAPIQPWDAMICTSHAVRDNIQRLLQAQAHYLQDRMGAQRLILPKMPVIPLGTHVQDFVFTTTQKAKARAKLGADAKTHVVLYVGRLSFHAKAHPLAMYQALQKASQKLPRGEKIMLVECGWHHNSSIEKAFTEAAQMACPDVRIIVLDGRDAENRRTAWAGANIFCSLSDNIQETFGITPVEAMAASLPVVVADWDGYRDTIRDGVDGFRIPTVLPPEPLGDDLATRHALGIDRYDLYCGYVSAFTAIDIDATAQAIEKLFASKELQKKMGAAGRKRAESFYDWRVIIAQYEELWAQMGEERKAQAGKMPYLKYPWPARMDPFASFAGYPTRTIAQETICSLSSANPVEQLKQLRSLTIVRYMDAVTCSEAECNLVLEHLLSGPRTVSQLACLFPEERQPLIIRSLTWLMKMGIVKIG